MPHVRICAGGAGQPAFLPQPFLRHTAWIGCGRNQKLGSPFRRGKQGGTILGKGGQSALVFIKSTLTLDFSMITRIARKRIRCTVYACTGEILCGQAKHAAIRKIELLL